MRKLLIALVSLALLGCGVDSYAVIDDPLTQLHKAYTSGELIDQDTSDFNPPCLGRVTSAFPFSKKVFISNLYTIRYLFDKNGLIPYGEFCIAFSGLRVYIQEWHRLDDQPGRSGMYAPFKGVYLGIDGVSLAHELLHVWDWQHTNLPTIFHTYWESNRYHETVREYHMYAVNLVPDIAVQQSTRKTVEPQ